jgi:two-component system, cell cycle response regulator DivK
MKKKILVVDDEPDVRTYLKMLLNEAGFEVITAANGMEAFDQARRKKPGLIVLDLLMPKNTGIEFYRRMRKDKGLSETPVIIVSALASRNLAVKQAAAVFDKPVDPDAFLAEVHRITGCVEA